MGKLNCSHNFLCHAEAFNGKDKIVGSWLIGCEAKIYTSFALNILEDIKNVFFLVFLIVVLNMNILSCIIIIQVINNCLKIDKGQ